MKHLILLPKHSLHPSLGFVQVVPKDAKITVSIISTYSIILTYSVITWLSLLFFRSRASSRTISDLLCRYRSFEEVVTQLSFKVWSSMFKFLIFIHSKTCPGKEECVGTVGIIAELCGFRRYYSVSAVPLELVGGKG